MIDFSIQPQIVGKVFFPTKKFFKGFGEEGVDLDGFKMKKRLNISTLVIMLCF